MEKFSRPIIERSQGNELTEQRYIYNGDPFQEMSSQVLRGNRPLKRRKRSPLQIIVMLIIVSILIVLYVWNKITVNRLVVEVNDLRSQYQKILNANEYLRAEISKKSSLERIGKIASEQLGLVYPKDQPIWFKVDFEKLENFQ